MNTLLAALSLLPAGIGAAALFSYRRNAKGLALMNAIAPSTAAEIAGKPPGTLVEITGTLRCTSLLASEFTQASCAYYDVKITREEEYWTNNSEGKQERSTRTVVAYTNKQHAPCTVEDATGSIAIDLEGATVEAKESLNRIGKPATQSGFRGLLETIGNAGDHYYENILAPDASVFVLGEVRPGGSIGAPAPESRDKDFVVSVKSRDQRAHDMARKGKWVRAGMIACALITVVLLIGAVAT